MFLLLYWICYFIGAANCVVTFTVENVYDDTVIDDCLLATLCNLRSALKHCIDVVDDSSDDCIIDIQVSPLQIDTKISVSTNSLNFTDPKYIQILGLPTLTTIRPTAPITFLRFDCFNDCNVALTIKNLYIEGFVATTDAPLALTQFTHPIIENVHFYSNFFTETYNGPGGLELTEADYFEIRNCNFVNNTGTFGGGLFIDNSNHGIIDGCNFISNTVAVNFNGGGGVGSALYFGNTWNNITVTNNVFDGNEAHRTAAVVLFSGETNFLTIYNCLFTNNIYDGSDSGYLLDLEQSNDIFDNVHISYCEFRDNDFGESSSMLHLTDVYNSVISNLVFVNNLGERAISVEESQNITMRDIIINQDSYEEATEITISDTFGLEISNLTHIGSEFLIQIQQSGSIVISDSFFSSSPCVAPVMLFQFTANVEFRNCVFANSTAKISGGILALVLNQNVSIINCTFRDNFVNVDVFSSQKSGILNLPASLGGAVSAVFANSAISIADSLFVNNTVESAGGALNFVSSNSDITISGCSFLTNRAGVSGGAISFGSFNSEILIDGCLFEGNEAGSGGAVEIGTFSSDVSMNNSVFLANHAITSCGALVLRNSAEGSIPQFNNLIFTGNSADDFGGAACFEGRGTISNSVFEGNFAPTSAGSLSVLSADIVCSYCEIRDSSAGIGGGMVLFDSNFHFMNSVLEGCSSDIGGFAAVFLSNLKVSTGSIIRANNATSFGGALSVETQSTLVIADSLVELNVISGSGGGGAVFLTSQSSLELLRCDVVFNSASFGGAVAATINSPVLVDSCTFLSNQAEDGDGGGIFTTSDALTITNSAFSVHTATGIGGALAVVDATLLSINSSTFFDNSADSFGGAIGMFNCELQINDTSFTTNSADDDGGAIYLAGKDAGSISYSSFSSNSVDDNKGGSIFVSIADLDPFSVRSTNFSTNSAKWGSAIFIESGLFLLQYDSFTNNSATSSGSVFWIPSGDCHPTLNFGNYFSGNTAGYGPDMSTTAQSLVPSSIVVEAASGVEIEPSKTLGSFFITAEDYYGNLVTEFLAESSGGGSADTQIPVSTQISTTSPCFGSLSGPTVGLWDDSADFVDFSLLIVECFPNDTVEVDFSATIDEQLLPTSIVVNLRACSVGEEEVGDVCVVCGEGKYSFEVEEPCEECPNGADCAAGGFLLVVDGGYWRPNDLSTDIRACWIAEPCEGGSSSMSQCMEGHTGAYCSVCEDGYAKDSSTGLCLPCAEASEVMLIAIVVLLLTIFVFGVIYSASKIDMVRDCCLGASQSLNRLWNSLSTSVRILLMYLQISATIPQVTNTKFPNESSSLIQSFGLLSFEPGTVLSFQCLDYSYDFHSRLLVATIWPLLAIAIGLLVVWIIYCCKRIRNSTESSDRSKSNSILIMLIISFIVFSSVSTIVAETFICEEFRDGSRLLVADYSIDCDSATHQSYMNYALLMIIVYPIGIPLGYLMLLVMWRMRLSNPDQANNDDDDNDDGNDKTSIGFLVNDYNHSCWYFEIIECVRRLLLTAIISVLYRNSMYQLGLLMVFAFTITTFYSYMNGFKSSRHNTLAAVCNYGIMVRILLAIMIKSDNEFPNLGICMVLVDLGVILFAAGVTTAGMKDKDEDTPVKEKATEMVRG